MESGKVLIKKQESIHEKEGKYSGKSGKVLKKKQENNHTKSGKVLTKKRKVSLKSGKHPPPLNFCYIQCFIVNFKCCFL